MCGKVEHKKCCNKYRICEYDSAKKLIDAAKLNKDDVFIRIADRMEIDKDGSIKSVISADLYCHNLCPQKHMLQFEHDMQSKVIEKPTITNMKHVLFNHALPYIIKLLNRGDCCSMSDIVDFSSSLLEEGEVLTSTFQNHDMKQLLLSHYGEQ